MKSKKKDSKKTKGISNKERKPLNTAKSIQEKTKKTSNVFRPDYKQTAALIKIGHRSSKQAIRESKALGLSITYLEKGILYSEHADGTREVVNPVKRLELHKSKAASKKHEKK